MSNKEILELLERAKEVGLTQERVAVLMNVSSGYWFKVRTGRLPVSDEILAEIRKLTKKLKAFAAA